MANKTPSEMASAVKTRAKELGFDLVGITDAEPSAFAPEYREWLERGYAGEMEYLKRNLERRLDPRELLPEARSIIVVAMNYYSDAEEGPSTPATDPDRAIFARYARGDDYHDVMSTRLRELLGYLREISGPEAEGRIYVDAGPILEREVARRAGIGWFGKNTLLINTRRGSYFFLGEIVTNVLLETDQPSIGSCGTCTRCIDACPTKAIVAPYQVDSRRCISYLTIEIKGPIPEEHAEALSTSGNRIYGCDICQEVCPFNRDRGTGRRGEWETNTGNKGTGEQEIRGTLDLGCGTTEDAMPCRADAPSSADLVTILPDAASPPLPSEVRAIVGEGRGEGNSAQPHGSTPTWEPAFQPRPFLKDLKDVKDLLYLTPEEFSAAFKGSAVKRAKRRGLLRNVVLSLAGRDDAGAIAALEHALNDPEELVRDAARRALAYISERRL